MYYTVLYYYYVQYYLGAFNVFVYYFEVRQLILQLFFFYKDLLHRKSVRYTGLQNYEIVPFNQFALVVPRRVSDREFTVLGSYEYSSEKQVQRKNTAAVG